MSSRTVHAGLVAATEAVALPTDSDYGFVCLRDADGAALALEDLPTSDRLFEWVLDVPELIDEATSMFATDATWRCRYRVDGGDETAVELTAAEDFEHHIIAIFRTLPDGVDQIYLPDSPPTRTRIVLAEQHYLMVEATFGIEFKGGPDA